VFLVSIIMSQQVTNEEVMRLYSLGIILYPQKIHDQKFGHLFNEKVAEVEEEVKSNHNNPADQSQTEEPSIDSLLNEHQQAIENIKGANLEDEVDIPEILNEIIDGFEIIESKDVEPVEEEQAENKDNQMPEEQEQKEEEEEKAEEVAIPKRWASLSDNADDSQDEICEPVDALNNPISNNSNTNDLNTNEKTSGFEPTED